MPADIRYSPEQLVLQDDPSYLPDFALPPLDLLAELNFPPPGATPRSGDSQSLTPFGSQVEGPMGGLVIPSSSSPVPPGFMMVGDGDPSSVLDHGSMFDAGAPQPLLAPDWEIDDEGNIIDFGDIPPVPPTA